MITSQKVVADNINYMPVMFVRDHFPGEGERASLMN
jgi:hypothetical protein